MNDLTINPDSLTGNIDDLQDYGTTLASLKERVTSVKQGLRSSIRIQNAIGSQLEEIAKSLENYNKDFATLATVLENSIREYQSTENVIMEHYLSEYSQSGNLDQSGGQDVSQGAMSKSINDLISEYLKCQDQGRKTILGRILEGTLKCLGDGDVADALKMINEGKVFQVFENQGKTFIKLVGNNGMTNAELSNWLKTTLGTGDWSDYLTRSLKNDGVEILTRAGNTTNPYKNLFEGNKYDKLNDYLEAITKGSKYEFAKTVGKAEFFKGMKFWNDFIPKEYSNLTKVSKLGKGVAAVGTTLDITKNFYEDIYKDGAWDFTPATGKKFVVDTTVDIASGAGAVAIGSAVGSCVVPPIGTVVGAATGFAVNWAINTPISGVDLDHNGESDTIVDIAKTGANYAVDKTVDFVSSAAGDVKDFFGSLF